MEALQESAASNGDVSQSRITILRSLLENVTYQDNEDIPSAVCGNDSVPKAPKECRASPRILWDFVDFCRARFKSEVTFAPKLRAFSQLVHVRIYEVAGIPFALSTPTHKIGFPGWPEPILDSVTGFGASIEKKGACTSPLFRFVSSLRSVPRTPCLAMPLRPHRSI